MILYVSYILRKYGILRHVLGVEYNILDVTWQKSVSWVTVFFRPTMPGLTTTDQVWSSYFYAIAIEDK